jgi:2-polyprenyl-3-methyl-5-hydroxy-6-metoxy-1,4-benzoquinol methylase
VDVTHAGHHDRHNAGEDWASRAEYLTLEAEVLLPYVSEVASWVEDLFREDGFQVRRILDVGSGPGVIACELSRIFPSAEVVAVDASPELLDVAATRAAAAGVTSRVATQQADLFTDLGGLGSADLIWMAMVLHHLGDEVASLLRLRGALNPGGVLVVIEHGNALRFLPDGVEIGRSGLMERLTAMDTEWLATMWDARPNGRQSDAGSTIFNPAGFELIAERMVHVQLPTPLSNAARRVVRNNLQRKSELFGERLDDQDRDALDALLEEDNPHGVMRLENVFLDATRHVYVARARTA